MQDNSQYIREWLIKGSHDLRTAHLAFKDGGLNDTVVVLLQQAVEKYLKGFLISKGWNLKKTHDLRDLLDKAVEYTPEFQPYVELVDRLTALYIEQRYPSRPPADYSDEEMSALIRQAEGLIKMIEEWIK